MTQLQSQVVSTDKDLNRSALHSFIAILSVAVIVTSSMVYSANTAVPNVDKGLKQARHSLLVYEFITDKLPGLNGNPAELNSNDLVGFPSNYNDEIRYSGSPSVNNFCLTIDVTSMLFFPRNFQNAHYIKASSDSVYTKKPIGC